jgi:hypothetical protein
LREDFDNAEGLPDGVSEMKPILGMKIMFVEDFD